MKKILIIVAVLLIILGIAYYLVDTNKKKVVKNKVNSNSNGKESFDLDKYIESQPVISKKNFPELTFGFASNGTSVSDEYFIARARNTSKEGSLFKVFLIDLYDVKNGTWGFAPQKMTQNEASNQFKKLSNSVVFKGIPQKEVEVFVIPKSLLVINASSANAWNPNDHNFTEFIEPDIFSNNIGDVVLGTGFLTFVTGIIFSVASAAVGGVLAISSVLFYAVRGYWVREANEHKIFNR